MMKYPLMRNNILREDLDAVIEHLKQDDPILTNGPMYALSSRNGRNGSGSPTVFLSIQAHRPIC